MKVKELFNQTKNTIDSWYSQGAISQDDYEHYMYHWENSTFRCFDYGFKATACPVCDHIF